MKNFFKWAYRICVLLLIILIIDFNSHWLKNAPQGGGRTILFNSILIGSLIILLITKQLVRRRK